MQKKKALLFTLMSLLLTGCNKDPFASYQYNADLPVLYRNGDILPLSDKGISHEVTTRVVEAETIIEKVTHHEAVLLFVYSDTCHACITIHDYVNNFLFQSDVECFSFGNGDNLTNLRKLKAAFPEMANVIKFETPVLYLFKEDGTIKDLNLLDTITEGDKFKEYMAGVANYSFVYTFEKADTLLSYINSKNSLVYFYENETGLNQYKEIVEGEFKASQKEKKIALCNYGAMNEDNKAKIQSKFGENPANLLFLANKGKEISAGQSLIDAKTEGGILASYYA